MVNRVLKYEIKVDEILYDFIQNEALPKTGVNPEDFWKGFSDLVNMLGIKNKNLLEKRKNIQDKINEWHIQNKEKSFNQNEYISFLNEIDYIVKEKEEFSIETNNVDPEIANISGPQLVVPIMNARYALNAANARWGSLYDALYGTDAMGDLPPPGKYSEERGAKVISFAKQYLDDIFPLNDFSWTEIKNIKVSDKELYLSGDHDTSLKNSQQFAGYIKTENYNLKEIILVKNGLHVRIIINPNHPIGKSDSAAIADILLESALTTIMDCEDSIAAVDSEDKVLAYKNWLGLMKGDLSEEFIKNENTVKRKLNSDINIIRPNGKKDILKGRSLMLNRNVGHLMTNPSILDKNDNEAPEGLIDAMCTTLIAIHDLNKKEGIKNSVKGSVYIVKPKMHGPEEVAFTNEIFTEVEKILGLQSYTVKLGIMDEERRTSVNLKECIREAKNRVAFINTGFLDRTGDEIHTSMEMGPVLRKEEMKNTDWIKAYEERNVKIGLACGLQNKAQIGKGMWAMPDLMKDMMEQKIGHLNAGANCAWVPSPTAATLHATHYHKINVTDIQNKLIKENQNNKLKQLLNIPISSGQNWSEEEINEEIENNAQGILGYVVRWVDQGIGCSKVPNIHDIGLMEDRATCRISSQALANWLHHGIITKKQLDETMKKMALIVDKQNKDDKNYTSMGPSFDTTAFKAACDLVYKGKELPSGYTEPVLHERRIELKSQ